MRRVEYFSSGTVVLFQGKKAQVLGRLGNTWVYLEAIGHKEQYPTFVHLAQLRKYIPTEEEKRNAQ